MAEIIHELAKALIMLAIVLITRYLVPWLAEKLGNERSETIRQEVEKLVLATQQVCREDTGSEKLSVVIYKVRKFLDERNISMTDEQIRDYIEAAVKAMKMADG